MNDNERFLFDLQGFITIPDALDADEIGALNEILDRRIADEVEPDAATHRFLTVLDWGQPYLDLIDHPAYTAHLEEIVDPEFRLDHTYIDIIRSGLSPIGAWLHGGGTPFDPTSYYRFANGVFGNGLTVVAINLRDVNPGDGGFACVPGSHKANLPFPDEWKDLTDPHPAVVRVTGPAGTAIVFTEALTHGPLPWAGEHERRTVFYKYSPHPVAWGTRYPSADDFDGLTERQRAILEQPNARYADRATRGM